MAGQQWTTVESFKVDVDVAEYIARNNLIVRVDDKGYPAVYFPCPSCAPSSCRCRRPTKKLVRLHVLAYDFAYDDSHPRRPGDVVHHQNLDKWDARSGNLGAGSRQQHARAHALRRRRFGHRKRHHFGGFRYRPGPPKSPVSRPDLVGTVVSPPETRMPRFPSLKRLVRDVENRLERFYPKLAECLAPLDSGAPAEGSAPRSEWTAPKSRINGIFPLRLEPTVGERAFVLLLVEHRGDLDAMAASVGERVEFLRELLKRPPVDLAIREWRKRRVLPLLGR